MFLQGLSTSEAVTLKPRGNGTWTGMHKKTLTLELENKRNLLGMGKHYKWNLLVDSQDKSLLKNYTFNKLAHDLSVNYEPEVKHIVLFVDGWLQGVYLLTTKVSVGRDKVNLGKDDYLFVWGGSHPQQMITYESRSWFDDTNGIGVPYVELLYPENDSTEGLELKRQYIQNYINAVEDEKSEIWRTTMNFLNMKRLENL